MNKLALNFTMVCIACSGMACLIRDTPSTAEPLHTFERTASVKTVDEPALQGNAALLSNICTQAIRDYINAVYVQDSTKLETLYVCPQADLMDMVFPTSVENTNVVALTPETSDAKKALFSKTTPFVNMVGFVGNEHVECIFVTFYPDFQHQFDCYLEYQVQSGQQSFTLQKARMEVLVYNKAGAPDHYAVFENGKYTGDKPLK